MSVCHINPVIFGQIRYYEANRCFNTEKVRRWNQHKITCDEIVSFDCGLFNLYEMESLSQQPTPEAQQIIAVIIRPGKEREWSLEAMGFTFCGYDLIEELSAISAITNCGGSFSSIHYEDLTEYGLIPTYKEAALTQLALMEEAPNEHHADCEILEIWRKIVQIT